MRRIVNVHAVVNILGDPKERSVLGNQFHINYTISKKYWDNFIRILIFNIEIHTLYAINFRPRSSVNIPRKILRINIGVSSLNLSDLN